jgi:hypothetical protein
MNSQKIRFFIKTNGSAPQNIMAPYYQCFFNKNFLGFSIDFNWVLGPAFSLGVRAEKKLERPTLSIFGLFFKLINQSFLAIKFSIC